VSIAPPEKEKCTWHNSIQLLHQRTFRVAPSGPLRAKFNSIFIEKWR
jgi:hypothetical protein